MKKNLEQHQQQTPEKKRPEDQICQSLPELESLLLVKINKVAFPKNNDKCYTAGLAHASDRLQEAYDLIMAHFTQEIEPEMR